MENSSELMPAVPATAIPVADTDASLTMYKRALTYRDGLMIALLA